MRIRFRTLALLFALASLLVPGLGPPAEGGPLHGGGN